MADGSGVGGRLAKDYTLGTVKIKYERAFKALHGSEPKVSFTTNGWYTINGQTYRKQQVLDMIGVLESRLVKQGKAKQSKGERKMARTSVHTRYYNQSGKRLPSVTTVIGKLGLNKRVLMHWAWKMGTEGKDYRKVTDEAANIGTIAHAMVEDRINEAMEELDPDHVWSPAWSPDQYPEEDIERAKLAFGAFEQWWDQHSIVPKASEMRLSHEQLGYGGTIDFVCSLDDTPALVDFKTSKGVYTDHIIQLAAYQQLFAANQNGMMLDPYLLRIDKYTGQFEFHHLPDLQPYWEIFEHTLEIYRLAKEVD